MLSSPPFRLRLLNAASLSSGRYRGIDLVRPHETNPQMSRIRPQQPRAIMYTALFRWRFASKFRSVPVPDDLSGSVPARAYERPLNPGAPLTPIYRFRGPVADFLR